MGSKILQVYTGIQLQSIHRWINTHRYLYGNVYGCVFAKNRPVSLNWSNYTGKINCVFFLFTWLQIMSAMFFLLNVAIENSPAYIYSLTPFAFLEHQTRGFYHTSEANLVPLLILIACIHIASFTSMFFSSKYLTGHRYFIHKKWSFTAHMLVKKSIPNWHLCITQMEKKWTKWYAMTLHVIAYHSKELLFGTHAFNFDCFLDDFNCVFTQICCLSVLLWFMLMLWYCKYGPINSYHSFWWSNLIFCLHNVDTLNICMKKFGSNFFFNKMTAMRT